jgi:NTP pyrophosphatase (non-canonical NTP hydrolase)
MVCLLHGAVSQSKDEEKDTQPILSGFGNFNIAMEDSTTQIQEIKDRVLAFARERDWEQFHAPKNLSMAIAAEAAELMEHFLWQSPEDSHEDIKAVKLRAKVEEELADIFIFAIEFANVTGINIAAIIEAKMAQNAKKYPVDKAKGRSAKYTEL